MPMDTHLNLTLENSEQPFQVPDQKIYSYPCLVKQCVTELNKGVVV